MPTLVHGNDAYVGVEIAEETAWGSDTGLGTFIGVPVIRETLALKFSQAPSSPEFGGLGGESYVELYQPRIEGEIVFTPRLDAKWFNVLLGHVMGTENLQNEEWIDGTAATAANTHWYLPSQQYRSLQVRVAKSGPTDSGSRVTYKGMIVTSMRIELPPDQLLQVAISFVGKEEVHASMSGQTVTLPTGSIDAELLWLSNSGAGFTSGATPLNRSVRSFTITFDRKINADPSFMNDLNTANQPGPTDNREVRCDVQGLLTQDFAGSGLPYREYMDKTYSKCRIKLRDSADAVSGKKYSMDIDFPSIVWNDGDASVKEAGAIPTSHSFIAKEGATTSPDTGVCDMRIGVFVNDTNDGNDHWTLDAGGVDQT